LNRRIGWVSHPDPAHPPQPFTPSRYPQTITLPPRRVPPPNCIAAESEPLSKTGTAHQQSPVVESLYPA
ncbi:MAG: hypothetical protein ACXWUF_21470, partial [Methylomagnum sp.]